MNIFINKILLFFGVLFLSVSAYCQTTQDIKKEADNLFEKAAFVDATPLYLQLLNVEPRSHELNFKYGTCLIFSATDKSEAIRFLSFSVKSSSINPLAHFYLGKAFHLNFQFSNAITSYEKFKSLASQSQLKDFSVDANINACKNGKQLLSNITDMIVMEKTEVKKQDFYELYKLDDIGGSLLITDQFQTKLDKKKGHRPIIYYPQNSPYIFYSSYGDNGNTGLDIYVKQKMPNGKWSQAVKVVGDVNTELDEDYPYLSQDGKYLYYSSKGHNSMGGYDVFRSKVIIEGSSFATPENMDFAVSSPNDDMLYIVDSLDRNAYFSSARESQDGKLYVYKVRVEKVPMQLAVLKGDFANEIDPSNRNIKIDVLDFTTGAKVGTYNSKPGNGTILLTIPKSGKYYFEMTVKGESITHRAEVSIPYIKEFRPLKIDLTHKANNNEKVIVLRTLFDDRFDDPTAIMADVYQRVSKLDPNANKFNIDSLNSLRNADNVFAEAGIDKYSTPEDIKELLEKAASNTVNKKAVLEENSFLAHNLAANKQSVAQEKMTQAKELIEKGLLETNENAKKSTLTQAYKLTAEAEKLNSEAVALISVVQKVEAELKRSDEELASLNNALSESMAIGQNDGEALNKFVENNTAVLSVASGNEVGSDLLKDIEGEVSVKKEELDNLTEKIADLSDREEAINTTIANQKSQLAATKKKKEIAIIEAKIESANSELALVVSEKEKNKKKLQESNANDEDIVAQLDALKALQSEANRTSENKESVSNTQKMKIKLSVKDQDFNENLVSAESVFVENDITGESIDLTGLNESNVVPVKYESLRQIENRIEEIISELQNEPSPEEKQKLETELSQLNIIKENKQAEVLLAAEEPIKKTDIIADYNNRVSKIVAIKDVTKQKEAQAKLNKDLKNETLKLIAEKSKEGGVSDANQLEIKQLNSILQEAESELLAYDNWLSAIENAGNSADFTYVEALEDVNDSYESRLATISSSDMSDEEKANELKVLNATTLANAKEKLQESEAALSDNPNNELAAKQKRQYERLVSDLESKSAIPLIDVAVNNNQPKSNTVLTQPDELVPNYTASITKIENSAINKIDKEKAKLNVNETLLSVVKNQINTIESNQEQEKSKENKKALASLETLQNELVEDISASKAIIDKELISNPSAENTVESIAPNYTSESYQINELSSDGEKIAAIKALNKKAIVAIDAEIRKTKIANAANPREELAYEIEELQQLKSELVLNDEKDFYGIVELSADEKLSEIKGGTNIENIEPEYDLKLQTIAEDAISNKDLERKKLALNKSVLAKTNQEIRRVKNGIATTPENKKQLEKRAQSLEDIKIILEEKIFESKAAVGEESLAFNVVVDVEDANPDYLNRINTIKDLPSDEEKEAAVIALNNETVALIEKRIGVVVDDVNENGKDLKKVLLVQKYDQLIAEIQANPQLPVKGSINGSSQADLVKEDTQKFPVIYKSIDITEAIPTYKNDLDSINNNVSSLSDKERSKIVLYDNSIADLKDQAKELKTYTLIESPNKAYAEEKFKNVNEIIEVLESEKIISLQKIQSLEQPQIFAGVSDVMADYDTRKEKIEYESTSTVEKLQKTNELNKVLLFEIDKKTQELEKLQKDSESDIRAESISKLAELSEAINQDVSQVNGILAASEEEPVLQLASETKFEPLDPDNFEDLLEVKQLNLIKKDVRLIKSFEKDIARLNRKKARLSGNEAKKVQNEIDKTISKQSTLHNRLISDLEVVIDDKLWTELSQSKENAIKIKGANMHSEDIRNAEEGILIAEAKIERAKGYRAEARQVKNEVVANKILLKAAQLEYEAQQLLELSNASLSTAAIVSELTPSNPVVVKVKESLNDRTSSELFKIANDIERRAFAAEDRAQQLADSALTVRKKYKEAILLQMEEVKEEALRLRQKSEVIREKAIEIESQETELLAVMPKKLSKDIPKTDQLIALKSDSYAKYFDEVKTANQSLAEAVKSQNEIDLLKLEATKIIKEAIVLNPKSTFEDHQLNPKVMAILTKIDKITEEQKAHKADAVNHFKSASELLNNSSDSDNVKESIVMMVQRNIQPNTQLVLSQEDIADAAIGTNIESSVGQNSEVGDSDNTSISAVNDNNSQVETQNTLLEASSDYIAPNKLNGQLFRITETAVYSSKNPIPVDAKQPEGLVYKVQVGAFRNPLPPQSFDKFAPISGQQISSGVTRYMVGYFTNFGPANEAKKEIRGIGGYSDAFVVAYFNGERIAISKARELEQDGVIPPAITDNNVVQPNNNIVNISQSEPVEDNSEVQQNSNSNGVVNPVEIDYVAPVTLTDKEKTSYYTSVPDAAQASQVEIINGLFYTVQIGVYSNPVPAAELFNVSPLNSQLTKSKKIRYSTGIYTVIDEAIARKNELVEIGIVDAFVTAYYNGERISITESKELLSENGNKILTNGKTISEAEGEPISRFRKENVYYRILLGKFKNTIPANVANYLFNDDNINFETEIDADNNIYLFTQKFSTLGEVQKRLVEINELGFEDLEILTFYNIQNIPFDEAQKIVNNEAIEDLTEFESLTGISANEIFYEAEAIYYRVVLEEIDVNRVDDIIELLNRLSNNIFESETSAEGKLLIHSKNLPTFAEAEFLEKLVFQENYGKSKVAAYHKYVEISVQKAQEIKGK